MNNVHVARTPKPNRKQLWVDAIAFTLEECVRFHGVMQEFVQSAGDKALPKYDFFHKLRGSQGLELVCGRQATLRLQEAVVDYLRCVKRADSISADQMLNALKPIIVDRFVTERIEMSSRTVEKSLASALKQCVKASGDSRHYIPCQLFHEDDPRKFEIGPVTFHDRQAFEQISEMLVAEHARVAAEKRHVLVFGKVLDYYRQFGWVAEVTVKACDSQMGKERAKLAVNAAVDFLHLLLGHYRSRRMVVGGPGFDTEIQGEIEVRGDDTLLSYSVGANSAVGFEKGWHAMIEQNGWQPWICSVGRALEAITNPGICRPLGLRMVDAVAWYGQAVRESSAAAAIIKSVSALERLVATEDRTDIAQTISERSGAIRYDPNEDLEYETIVAEMQSIYKLRSRLVHGSLSPFDPEVRARRSETLNAVESVLIQGLVLFDQNNLFDRALTNREMRVSLEKLVLRTRRLSDEKRAKRAVPADF
jgi:Apea-like HEPN